MLFKRSAIALLLAASCVLGPAAAQDVTVSSAGATAQEVHARVVDAARDVCRRQFVRGAHGRRDLETCVRLTVDAAISMSGSATLRAAHEAMAPSERYGSEPLTLAGAGR